MFNGRTILPNFPEDFIKVVNFLNEKATAGEFAFNDSMSYWEDNENIISTLGLGLDGSGYYFAVALAYIAHQNGGAIVIREGINIWRWAWSLNTIAKFGEWSPEFMGQVILSISKKEDGIGSLMNTVAHTYGRTNYDNGLALMDELPQYRTSIMAGLIENDYPRYCNQFPPSDNPEDFVNVVVQTSQLSQESTNDAFDKVMKFDSFISPLAMTFLLKVNEIVDENRKQICENKVKELLTNGNTAEYVNSISNWAYSKPESTPFMEECIFALVKGLGKDNSSMLTIIDNAIVLHHEDTDFLIKLIACVAENLEPTDILKLDKCLLDISKKKDKFVDLVLAFLINPKGMYRLVGRKLWDDYHLECSDFKVSDLDETLQSVFIISMLQDFGNPERRLPKLLPLLSEGSDKVRSVLMMYLRPYLDDYMGHVIKAIDKLKIESKEVDTIKTYFEGRSKALKARRELKELSPVYAYEKEYREAIRKQNEHMQEQMKEAEARHRPTWKDLFATVILARGGGWRDEKGNTQHLPLTTFSIPSRMMAESLSPKEQEDWLNELLKNWDDEKGNH